jgi:hypothetical protein
MGAFMDSFFQNLPKILEAIDSNNQGFVAAIWIISGIALFFNFRKSSEKIRAFLFVFSLLGIFYLAYVVIQANNEIVATQRGWTYYEVDQDGNVTPNDGRLESLDQTRRKYSELKVGGQLKTREAAQLYDSPVKPRNLVGISEDRSCFMIEELGHEIAVESAASGGWLKVKVIRCT